MVALTDTLLGFSLAEAGGEQGRKLLLIVRRSFTTTCWLVRSLFGSELTPTYLGFVCQQDQHTVGQTITLPRAMPAALGCKCDLTWPTAGRRGKQTSTGRRLQTSTLPASVSRSINPEAWTIISSQNSFHHCFLYLPTYSYL